MKACHNVSSALLQSVAEIGTQSAMESSRKTLHKFSVFLYSYHKIVFLKRKSSGNHQSERKILGGENPQALARGIWRHATTSAFLSLEASRR
jgi:hypothetical protein